MLEIRSILKNVAPHATEALKWGKPVLEEGRILFSYAAYKVVNRNQIATRLCVR